MTRALARLLCAASIVIAPASAQQFAPVFRSSVEAVLVPAWVKEGNRPVPQLTAADLDLLDNGVPQLVTSVAAETLPVDVTLVLDTSGSISDPAMRQFKADVQSIAAELRATDRVRVVTVSTDVRDLFDLRPGGAALPLDGLKVGGTTSFYNALTAALLAFPLVDRPQVIFAFSDGLDTTSFLDPDQVARAAGRSGAALYVALVRPGDLSSPRLTPYAGGPNRVRLREAVARTGGVLYERSVGASLAGLFRQVLQDFRASYLLTYTPSGVDRRGWHDIDIRTKSPHYVVRARKGYDGGR